MNMMIASDLHGLAYYCRKMMEAYRESGADRLMLLGDILYHGPRNDLPRDYAPKEVIAMLNPMANQILCVRGNCEAEVDQMVLDFPVLAEYALILDGSREIFVTHGHVYNEQNLPPLASGDVLLHGHTHVPIFQAHSKTEDHPAYTYVNPGSVSIPKEDSPHTYIIYNQGVFRWYDLDTGEMYMEH